MTGALEQLVDPGAMAIVVAGTALATAARCGMRALWCAGSALVGLGPRFDEAANRVAVARTATAIERQGPLVVDLPLPPDPALARMVDSYCRHGSLDALRAVRETERHARDAERARAMRVFEYAGEVAPVFGLVGTLFSITQLVPQAEGAGIATLAAISTAVLSSLYGVLLAHLVCIPLAQRIERRSEREETARELLADWFEHQLQNRSVTAPARLRGVA